MEFEIGYGGNIEFMKISKYYRVGLFFFGEFIDKYLLFLLLEFRVFGNYSFFFFEYRFWVLLGDVIYFFYCWV